MSALRNLRQLAASSSRTLATRSLTSATRAALPRAAVRAAVVPASRAFSMSVRRFGEGASDPALSQKIAEEITFEKESSSAEEPDFLKSFKANGVWEIQDTPGNDEVTLVRKFGNEEIRLVFSIADLHAQEEPEFDEDNAPEDAEENVGESYPIRCSFSIKKPGSTKGALTIDAMCQDDSFIIDNISFYADGQTATELTAEADWQRRGLYIGPQFDTLDVAVQDEFEKFLTERGINETLAYFIPEYAEWKEQKEYVQWLNNIKGFIDA
ncbi:unnamed protein product [Peniophora sp. CBMAI 1063]|nr:unnamed protein product [Peniophora sp. CBMAI 1063]